MAKNKDRSVVYQDLKRNVLKRNENNVTPGIGGGAYLSSPNRDTMIQEAPTFKTTPSRN